MSTALEEKVASSVTWITCECVCECARVCVCVIARYIDSVCECVSVCV